MMKKNLRRTKKPKSPEEEEELRSQLAATFNYAYTEEGAKRCLEWVKSAPEMALDIETYGRLKRDGLLYTKCSVRLISLHYGGESWFIDCDHVPNELVVPILEELQDKPKYLHNALFDIPRLYRRFGVLLDRNVHDTMLASRVARAGEWEKKKFKVIQKAHSLDDCLRRELGIEIPKDRKLKWGGPLQEEHLEYATDDVAHLKELYEALREVLREHGVEERYEAISSAPAGLHRCCRERCTTGHEYPPACPRRLRAGEGRSGESPERAGPRTSRGPGVGVGEHEQGDLSRR